MSAEQRRAAAIVGSLVLWAPTLVATLSGGLGLSQGVVRYVAALCLAWAALAAIDRLVAGYRTGADPGAPPRPDVVTAGGRRATDRRHGAGPAHAPAGAPQDLAQA